MLRIQIVKVDESLDMCDIEVIEKGVWIETCLSESLEEAETKKREFMAKRFPKE